MPGERFSVLYVRPGDPAPDSARARHRVGSLLRESVFQGHIERLAIYIGRELGVAIPGDGKYPSCWHLFIRECRTADFLDTVTVIYRYLFWHVGETTANWWRKVVRQIFADENLAYEIDDVGGVRPKIDREFQRNMASAVAGLQSERHQTARDLLERALTSICSEPPNYRQAWQATFSAVEALFGLMFPDARLAADEVERCLLPIVQRAYAGDPAAQRAAQGMLAGFQVWVEASRVYRRHPGAAEVAQPPDDVAILAISCGASMLRWLAGFDEERAASAVAARASRSRPA